MIVGAKLEAGPGRAPLEYSVVVVADGKFRGRGAAILHAGSHRREDDRGLGMTIEPVPGGDPIEAGPSGESGAEEAPTERVMRNGEWVQ